MTNFITCNKHKDGSTVKFTFIPKIDLPLDLSISNTINFVFVCGELLMSMNEDLKWNVVYGKIKDEESWQDSVIRETNNEIGVSVDELFLIGYIICDNEKESVLSGKTYFPVCYSFPSKILHDWQFKESKKRDWFSDKHIIENLKSVEDGEFLLKIY